jgi:hypothetical protein
MSLGWSTDELDPDGPCAPVPVLSEGKVGRTLGSGGSATPEGPTAAGVVGVNGPTVVGLESTGAVGVVLGAMVVPTGGVVVGVVVGALVVVVVGVVVVVVGVVVVVVVLVVVVDVVVVAALMTTKVDEAQSPSAHAVTS